MKTVSSCIYNLAPKSRDLLPLIYWEEIVDWNSDFLSFFLAGWGKLYLFTGEIW